MLSLVVRFCSITIISNVRIVKANSTTEELTTITKFTEPTVPTRPRPTTPSLDDYDWDLFCKLQPNGYDCLNDGIGSTRYYYDAKLEDCTDFVFGGCGGNHKNIFLTMKDCRQTCREPGRKHVSLNYSPNVFCRLQPDFGECADYNPMFYYSVTHHKCIGFSFSGCGGNQNRFTNQNLCHQICEDSVDAYGNPVEFYLKYKP